MAQPDFRAAAQYLNQQGLFTPERFFELAMAGDADELDISLGYVQRMARAQFDPIWQELAAKYLPQLVERWRADEPGPVTTSSVLINVISYTPYFARFSKTPAGAGMAALQAKRAADAADALRSAPEKTVAEVFQFLATLLVLQMDDQFGTDVDLAVTERLVPLLKQLMRKPEFRDKLGSETPERVLGVLSTDPRDHRQMRPLLLMMKGTLEMPLKECGVRDCDSAQQGKELMKCGRCKTAVYCSPAHQKQSWPHHKKHCFAVTF